jgi:hypothetical protein
VLLMTQGQGQIVMVGGEAELPAGNQPGTLHGTCMVQQQQVEAGL